MSAERARGSDGRIQSHQRVAAEPLEYPRAKPLSCSLLSPAGAGPVRLPTRYDNRRGGNRRVIAELVHVHGPE